MWPGALIKLFYGVRYTDMCAYRAIRRETLLQLGMRERTYGWNLEMQMRVARAGLRVLELPVAYRRRAGGESKVAGNLRGTIRAGSRIIATFARVAMEHARRLGLRSFPRPADVRSELRRIRVRESAECEGGKRESTPLSSPPARDERMLS